MGPRSSARPGSRSRRSGLSYELGSCLPCPRIPRGSSRCIPWGRGPILRDGTWRMPDSSVICAYLRREEVPVTCALGRADPADFAKAAVLSRGAETSGVAWSRVLLEPLRRSVASATAQRGGCRSRPTAPTARPGAAGSWTSPSRPAPRRAATGAGALQHRRRGPRRAPRLAPRPSRPIERSDRPAHWPRSAALYEALVKRPSFLTVASLELSPDLFGGGAEEHRPRPRR